MSPLHPLLSLIPLLLMIAPAAALPPPEDVPEEVLRTQIILDGRSPQSGELLSADEYAEEQAATDETIDEPGMPSGQIHQLVMLLRIRKAARLILPIIP